VASLGTRLTIWITTAHLIRGSIRGGVMFALILAERVSVLILRVGTCWRLGRWWADVHGLPGVCMYADIGMVAGRRLRPVCRAGWEV
jgi:hypothetical protein